MHVDLTAVMAVVIVIAIGANALAHGRWSPPWWLVVVGAVVSYPCSHTLLDALRDAPGGWLRWAFQVACGMLVAVLAAPLYHRLHTSDSEVARSGGREVGPIIEVPRPSA